MPLEDDATYYVEKNTAVAEVERIISMDDEDVEEILTEDSASIPERTSQL